MVHPCTKFTQGFLRFCVNEVKIYTKFIDLWTLANLAQNLISSSTPGGVSMYQVWWKSTQGFLRFRVNEVKIAYLYQVHWPLTLDVGGSRPKSNQFIYSWWCTPVPSLMKFHQVILELSHKRGKIAYLDQVHWPLTLDIGRISPKILSVHLLPVVHPCTKFDENPPRVFWDFALTGGK